MHANNPDETKWLAKTKTNELKNGLRRVPYAK